MLGVDADIINTDIRLILFFMIYSQFGTLFSTTGPKERRRREVLSQTFRIKAKWKWKKRYSHGFSLLFSPFYVSTII